MLNVLNTVLVYISFVVVGDSLLALLDGAWLGFYCRCFLLDFAGGSLLD